MSKDEIIHTVDGLVFCCENGVARIRDIDLAVRLGKNPPRKIRPLIRRMIKDGDLSDVLMRAATARIKNRQGFEDRTVLEYWLTEAQAIKVAMMSGTAKGHALFDEVVRVFILARNGLLPAAVPAHYGPDLDHIRTGIDRLLERADVRAGRVQDSDYARRKIKGLIDATAEALEKHFQYVHGKLKKEMKVPGYLMIPLVSIPETIGILHGYMMRNTKVAKLAKQLSLWPLDGGTPLIGSNGRKGGNGRGGSGGQLDS